MRGDSQELLTIQPATVDDVPTILGFIRGLAEYEKLSHEMEATEDQLREHLFGARSVAEALLARLNGQAVGFALFFTNFSTFAGKPGIWIEDIFILEQHRRQGIGRALIAAVARIAVERGYGAVEWTALDWNEPALRMYHKLGAVAMSEWTTQRLAGEALRELAKS
jgi:GNAT superfamily N-acetyltransferase